MCDFDKLFSCSVLRSKLSESMSEYTLSTAGAAHNEVPYGSFCSSCNNSNTTSANEKYDNSSKKNNKEERPQDTTSSCSQHNKHSQQHHEHHQHLLPSCGGQLCGNGCMCSSTTPTSISSTMLIDNQNQNLEYDRSIIQENQQLLLNTWNDDFEALFQLGSDIYLSIFEVDPTTMDLFPALRKYPGSTWVDSKEFRSQALRFVQVLSHSVKNLKTPNRLDPLLHSIGQRHVKLETSRGFKAEHWDIFEEAIRLTMEANLKRRPDIKELERQKAVLAWQALARYIVAIMKQGFYAGGGLNNSHAQFSSSKHSEETSSKNGIK